MSDAQQPPPLRLRPRLQASEPAAASSDPKSAQPAKEPDKPSVGSEAPPSPSPAPDAQSVPAGNPPPPPEPAQVKLKLKAKPSISALPPLLNTPSPAESIPLLPEAAIVPPPSAPPTVPAPPIAAKTVEAPPLFLAPAPVVPPAPAPGATPPPVVPSSAAPTIPPSPVPPEIPAVLIGTPRPSTSQRPGGGGPIPRPPARLPHIQPSRAASGSGSLRTGYQPQQPTERKSFKVGATLALLAGILLIVGVAYLGYAFLIKEDPKPVLAAKQTAPNAKPAAIGTETATAQTKPSTAPAGTPAAGETTAAAGTAGTTAKAAETAATPPTSTPAVSQPKPADINPTGTAILSPKSPIDRAQQVIAEHRAVEQGRIDLAADGSSPTETPSQVQPVPPKPKGRPTFSEISPGISATNRDIAATPQATSGFRRFVGDMVIRGVFQGAHPRAHINGRMVSQGEMVERNLGIVFESIDSDKKTITFRDGNGAVITRRY